MTRAAIIRSTCVHLLLMALAGYLAYRFGDRVPRWVHVAAIGVSAGLVTVLSTMALKVLDKFDGLQREAEGIEHAARTNGIYGYVHSARAELVAFFFVTVLFGLVNGGIAVALGKEGAVPDSAAAHVIATGYAGVVVILFFAVRVTRLFLRVDIFRRELFTIIKSEQARVATLKALTPTVLTAPPSLGDTKPPTAIGRGTNRGRSVKRS